MSGRKTVWVAVLLAGLAGFLPAGSGRSEEAPDAAGEDLLAKLSHIEGERWAQKTFRQHKRERILAKYGDLLEEWKLGADDRKAIEAVLVEREIGLEVQWVSFFDETVSGEALLEGRREILARSDKRLSRLLTPERLARLTAYERELPERERRRKVDRKLSGLGLEPDRVEPVRVVLLEEARLAEGREDRSSAEGIGKARLKYKESKTLWDAVKPSAEARQKKMDRLRPLLTPGQYEILRTQEEAEVDAARKSCRMMDEVMNLGPVQQSRPIPKPQ